MPIYEYLCADCGKRFEKIVMGGGDAGVCPHCSGANLKLQLSVFATKGGNGGSTLPSDGGGCCGPSGCGCH